MTIQALTAASPPIQEDATVLINVRHLYGKTRLYPACAKAQLFLNLCGDKTIPHTATATIRALGYELIAVDANGNPLGRWID